MNFVTYLLSEARDNTSTSIFSGTEQISHQEIYTYVNQLASYITGKIDTGKRVLLLADNNVFFVISYLAIIRSGNVVVPIDTKAPNKDISYYINVCDFAMVFVQEKYVPKIQDLIPKMEFVTDNIYRSLPEVISSLPETSDGELAAIIFTSGSTGEKKGVMLSHENLIANTASILEYLELKETDRVCVVLPFYYCYGLSLLHTHIKAGGSIVLSNHPFIGGALRDIDKYECTGFAGVPSTFQILIANTKFLTEELPTLRYFTQAGGKLPNKFIRMVAEAFPDKKFVVMYGATEATARMSYLPAELCLSKLGSIGKGIPGVKLKVVAEGRDVQPGEVGEIIASGKNIMQGYYMDPQGTAEVLIDGWYHTGDLGTVDEDGFIYVVGRSKNIIKCGGFRVSPYEIEGEICKLPGVEDVAVIGREDNILGEAIVAFIRSSTLDPAALQKSVQEFCRKTFPSHKIPNEVHILKELPLNSSNKVDREKLKHMVE
jgi:long-chain acyl-CoA synthetase